MDWISGGGGGNVGICSVNVVSTVFFFWNKGISSSPLNLLLLTKSLVGLFRSGDWELYNGVYLALGLAAYSFLIRIAFSTILKLHRGLYCASI